MNKNSNKLVRFDWAIKYLLRNKANFDILEGFLSELLKTDIHIETLLESEGNKKDARDKYNRVDVLVNTGSGEKIIVEVQCDTQWDYLSRILYGTSKVVCEYLKEGDAYSNIKKVISISIVYFELGYGKDYLYKGRTTFEGLHYHDALVLNASEKALYVAQDMPSVQAPEDIFPEYYIIKITAFHQKVQDKIDEWIYFLKNSEIKPEFQAKGLSSAAKKLDICKLSEEDRRAYEAYQESLHDDGSFNAMMDLNRQKGVEEGIEKGIEKAKADIALQMLSEGISIGLIVKITGLTETELLALKTGLR